MWRFDSFDGQCSRAICPGAAQNAHPARSQFVQPRCKCAAGNRAKPERGGQRKQACVAGLRRQLVRRLLRAGLWVPQPRIEPLLSANFKVVHVDVGRYDKNLDLAKKYQVDLEKGIPSLAVISPQGAVLYSTAQFERARVMTEEDVIQFLNTWKPSASARQ